MSKNYKYFSNPLVMSFGIIFRGVGGHYNKILLPNFLEMAPRATLRLEYLF